jgi:hypothetical protein
MTFVCTTQGLTLSRTDKMNKTPEELHDPLLHDEYTTEVVALMLRENKEYQRRHRLREVMPQIAQIKLRIQELHHIDSIDANSEIIRATRRLKALHAEQVELEQQIDALQLLDRERFSRMTRIVFARATQEEDKTDDV